MKARIKIGAAIYQDRCFGNWPACLPPKGWAADAQTVFEATQRADGSWICRADGYGAGLRGGPEGIYGNGAITVHDHDGIEALEAHNVGNEGRAR